MGRWDYDSWFWPPRSPQTNGPVANPLAGTTAARGPPFNPGTPNAVDRARGLHGHAASSTAWPTRSSRCSRKAYRFRILNACNDRMLNLQLYYAKSNAPMWNANGTLNNANAGEVPMVPAAAGHRACRRRWPTDGRDGGVPIPRRSVRA